jgi:hypothetical protein
MGFAFTEYAAEGVDSAYEQENSKPEKCLTRSVRQDSQHPIHYYPYAHAGRSVSALLFDDSL